VPAELVAELAKAGGPAASDPWWVGESGTGFYVPDEGSDWIEAIANGEEAEAR
jgi:hypothetical protein